MTQGGDAVAVQVALRVRPLVPSEIEQGCVPCLDVTPGEPQITVGGEKTFTFDHVFSATTPQAEVYSKAVDPLLDAFFRGFNTTVFAYGQTGSGKTHTMGTNASADVTLDEKTGIIPRMVSDMYARIEQEGTSWKRDITVSFLEIHNDDIRDLLDQVRGLGPEHRVRVALRNRSSAWNLSPASKPRGKHGLPPAYHAGPY